MNILLTRLRLIGDVVFTTPAVRALRRQFPDARIVYLVESHAAPVIIGNPHLDQVIVATSSGGWARLGEDFGLARRLRRERFDLAIDFHGGPRSSLLTWASGAHRRIGYRIAGRAWMYSEVVARPRALRPRHSVENQWDLLEPLGIAPPDPVRDPTEMPEDPSVADRVRSRLARAGLALDRHTLIVVHASAGNQFRRWPAEAFRDLLTGLAREDRMRRLVLTAGPADRDAATAIAQDARARLGAQADAIPEIGDFTLTELRSLIGQAALFIGGDSGPLHIAGTTTTPVVGIFGPTLAARSAPWRDPRWVTESVDSGPLPCRPCDQRRCEPGDFRCLTLLPADIVIAAAERALSRSSPPPGRDANPTRAVGQ